MGRSQPRRRPDKAAKPIIATGLVPAGWSGGDAANIEERYALLELLGLAGELFASGSQLLRSGGVLLCGFAELTHSTSDLHY